MDFANERYVRLYTRDTTEWLLLGWQGQTVFSLLYRKADRSGVVALSGLEAWEVAVLLCGLPEDVARAGMAPCLRKGWIVVDGDRLVFPKYIEANECAQSDAQRQRESRARRAVTKRDVVESQNVTECHDASQGVTPSHSVPSRADPSEEELRSTPPPRAHEEQNTIQIGHDFMYDATGRYYPPVDWRQQLDRIGSKPLQERTAALAAIQADPWCKSNTAVTPAHVLRKWPEYLNPPKLKSTVRAIGRYAGPSVPSSPEVYEADRKVAAPWD